MPPSTPTTCLATSPTTASAGGGGNPPPPPPRGPLEPGSPSPPRGGPPRPRLRSPLRVRDGLPPLDQYAKLEHKGDHRVAGYVEASRGCLHLCPHCPIPPVYGGRFFIVPP